MSFRVYNSQKTKIFEKCEFLKNLKKLFFVEIQAISMTAQLPRLTPCQTPISAPMMSEKVPAYTRRPSTTHVNVYATYPPLDRCHTMDLQTFPKAVNPLAPKYGRPRINHSHETQEAHYQNEKRKLLMQQREHYRCYKAWARPFYGTPAEKEEYR